MEHVHGLGIRGDTLYIATHAGLWTARPGSAQAERFGSSRQDIMGFSVAGGGRFLGSGHPAPDQGGPPNLGLIESRDAGRTWQGISLSGDADFHVLVSAGRRVYGYDGTQGRLMVSSDGGRSWIQRTPPAPTFSLAVDPESPTTIVAATEGGLFASSNAGRSWRQLRKDLAGLLAWPRGGRLYLLGADGAVRASSDGGSGWRATGIAGDQPSAFMAHGSDLYAALADATVKRSSDGGRTWTVRATP